MPNPYQIPPDAMVSSQGPKPMGFWEQLKSYIPFGGPDDIELENESGMVDPRIPAPLAALRRAFNTTNEYAAGRQNGQSAIDALRQAGRR